MPIFARSVQQMRVEDRFLQSKPEGPIGDDALFLMKYGLTRWEGFFELDGMIEAAEDECPEEYATYLSLRRKHIGPE